MCVAVIVGGADMFVVVVVVVVVDVSLLCGVRVSMLSWLLRLVVVISGSEIHGLYGDLVVYVKLGSTLYYVWCLLNG